jgi:hypothetical protein
MEDNPKAEIQDPQLDSKTGKKMKEDVPVFP